MTSLCCDVNTPDFRACDLADKFCNSPARFFHLQHTSTQLPCFWQFPPHILTNTHIHTNHTAQATHNVRLTRSLLLAPQTPSLCSRQAHHQSLQRLPPRVADHPRRAGLRPLLQLDELGTIPLHRRSLPLQQENACRYHENATPLPQGRPGSPPLEECQL